MTPAATIRRCAVPCWSSCALLLVPATASAKLTRCPAPARPPRWRSTPRARRSSRGTCSSPAAKRSRCAGSRPGRPRARRRRSSTPPRAPRPACSRRCCGSTARTCRSWPRASTSCRCSRPTGGDVRPEGPDQLGHVLHRRDRGDGAVALGFGSRFTASRIGGALETRTVDLNPGFGSFQAVGFAGGRPVYVSGGRAPRTAVSAWTGSGDIFDRSTWAHRRGPAMVYYDLAGGSRGLWLVHERRRGIDDDVVVRRWQRGHFGSHGRSRARPAT